MEESGDLKIPRKQNRLGAQPSRSLPFSDARVGAPPWFIPSLALLLVFIMAARTPLDSDMWWHLRAGETALQTGQPVLQDIFSHTRAGAPWVNHSWLSQVGLALTFRLGGMAGLAAWVALLAATSLGLVYLQMEGHALLRAFILVLAATVAAPVWAPRPQLATLVLLGWTGWLLYLYKWRRKDRLWLLGPSFLLWSNLHGGYVLGLLMVGSVVLGEALNHLLGFSGEEVLSWKRISRLAAWGAAAGLFVLINPNGIAMWAIPFQTVNIGALQSSIPEWASPDFHQLSQQPFLWMLIATLGAAGFSRRRLDGSDLVGVAVFAYLGFLARRNYAPFAMVAAPVLARHATALLDERLLALEDWLRRVFPHREAPRTSNRNISPGAARWINLAMLVFLGAAAAGKLYLVSRPEFVEPVSRHLYPVQAVWWISENQPEGSLFNAYDWGGYLLWSLPAYPVFVDGRTDLYGEEVLTDYARVAAGQDGWEEVLGRYGIHLVLIPSSSKLSEELSKSPDWQPAYDDQLAVVFTRRQ